MTKTQSRCHGNHCDSCHQPPPVLIPDLKIKSQHLYKTITHSLTWLHNVPPNPSKLLFPFTLEEQHSNSLFFALKLFFQGRRNVILNCSYSWFSVNYSIHVTILGSVQMTHSTIWLHMPCLLRHFSIPKWATPLILLLQVGDPGAYIAYSCLWPFQASY